MNSICTFVTNRIWRPILRMTGINAESGYTALATEAMEDFKSNLFYNRSGVLDELLGVDCFWTEKLMLFTMFFQEIGIIWSYPAFHLPMYFYGRTRFFRLYVLDLYASSDGIPDMLDGAGGLSFDIVVILCLSSLYAAWAFIRKLPLPFYFTRNAERMLYFAVLAAYPMFATNLLKYWICNSDGRVETFECSPAWSSLIFGIFGIPILCVVPWIAYLRIHDSLIHLESLRHENYVRSREVEYLLRINMEYRNSRLWMASSYRRQAVFFDLLFMVRVVLLLVLMCAFSVYRPQDIEKQFLVPSLSSTEYDQISAACALSVFLIPRLYFTFFLSPYRCPSSNACFSVLGWLNTVNVIWGLMKAGKIPNPDDFTLYDIMMGYNLLFLGILLVLLAYWYIIGHHFRHFDKVWQRHQQFEKLLVPATPHPSGERGHLRWQCQKHIATKKEELIRCMQENEAQSGDTDRDLLLDAAECQERFDTVEREWRSRLRRAKEELHSRVADPNLSPDDLVLSENELQCLSERIEAYDKLLAELRMLELSAEDTTLTEEERLKAATQALAVVESLETLVGQLSDPSSPEAAAEDAASQGTDSVRSSEAITPEISPSSPMALDLTEAFMKSMDQLHYDGSWIDGGVDILDDSNRPFYHPFYEILPSNNKLAFWWRGFSFIVHRWPVHRLLLEEIIQDNQVNHYVDCIRNAKRYLAFCISLHQTPEFLPIAPALPHLRDINACLRRCKQQRLTHHCHSIHPLQMALEELLDALLYEFSLARQYSVLHGHRAQLIPWASAFLHRRLIQHHVRWVLLSATMKRILLKLLAVRMFTELVIEKQVYLRCLAAQRRAAMENTKVAATENPFAIEYYLSPTLEIDGEAVPSPSGRCAVPPEDATAASTEAPTKPNVTPRLHVKTEVIHTHKPPFVLSTSSQSTENITVDSQCRPPRLEVDKLSSVDDMDLHLNRVPNHEVPLPHHGQMKEEENFQWHVDIEAKHSDQNKEAPDMQQEESEHELPEPSEQVSLQQLLQEEANRLSLLKVLEAEDRAREQLAFDEALHRMQMEGDWEREMMETIKVRRAAEELQHRRQKQQQMEEERLRLEATLLKKAMLLQMDEGLTQMTDTGDGLGFVEPGQPSQDDIGIPQVPEEQQKFEVEAEASTMNDPPHQKEAQEKQAPAEDDAIESKDADAVEPQTEKKEKKKKKKKPQRSPEEELEELHQQYQAMPLAELKAVKHRLASELSEWKATFITENRREPQKRDIQPLPIAKVHAEYKVVLEEVRRRKEGNSSGVASSSKANEDEGSEK